MFWSREARRLARRVDKLEAEVQVLLQLSAIQITDPAAYERVAYLAAHGWETEEARDAEPEGEADGAGAGTVEDQLANMMRYTGCGQQPEDERGG